MPQRAQRRGVWDQGQERHQRHRPFHGCYKVDCFPIFVTWDQVLGFLFLAHVFIVEFDFTYLWNIEMHYRNCIIELSIRPICQLTRCNCFMFFNTKQEVLTFEPHYLQADGRRDGAWHRVPQCRGTHRPARLLLALQHGVARSRLLLSCLERSCHVSFFGAAFLSMSVTVFWKALLLID